MSAHATQPNPERVREAFETIACYVLALRGERSRGARARAGGHAHARPGGSPAQRQPLDDQEDGSGRRVVHPAREPTSPSRPGRLHLDPHHGRARPMTTSQDPGDSVGPVTDCPPSTDVPHEPDVPPLRVPEPDVGQPAEPMGLADYLAEVHPFLVPLRRVPVRARARGDRPVGCPRAAGRALRDEADPGHHLA